MRSGFIYFVIAVCIASQFWGCGGQNTWSCKPMLFRCQEYGYQAEDKRVGYLEKLNDSDQIITLSSLKLSVPKGWRTEKREGQTYVFRSDAGKIFLCNLYPDRPFSNNAEEINLIGCIDYKKFGPVMIKTEREHYTAIFLFSDSMMADNPTFWEFSVLWSKSELLRDAVALYHYQGDNLEAFQRNMNPERSRGSVQCEIVVFPNKIAPDYITIASIFTDDAFFADFLDMINTLNP